MIDMAVIVDHDISHCLHWSPLNPGRCFPAVFLRKPSTQFTDLKQGKTDGTLIICISRIDLIIISIAFNRSPNGHAIIPNMLESLIIRLRHVSTPFL